MSLILESSIVVVIESIPFEVSTSNVLVSFAIPSSIFVAVALSMLLFSFSLNDFFGSVAVFLVVFVCVVDVSLRIVEDVVDATGGEAMI